MSKGNKLLQALSLRAQLILLLIALISLATFTLGSIAFTSSRAIIEGSAVREVGIAANARKQALLTVFTEQKARAEALLKSASLGCAPEEAWCLRKVLNDFVATGGASAARLIYKGYAPIAVGPGGAGLASIAAPPEDQLARFDFDANNQPYYVMVIRTMTADGESQVSLRGDMHAVNRIFGDRYGLGRSGETLLTNSSGRLLTVPRSEDESTRLPLGGQATSLCSAGPDGEVLDQDHRGVAVIRAFRRMNEISGACVVAQIDQAEAFAPTDALRRRVAAASGLLAVLAIACSLLVAQLVSRPMGQLSNRVRLLQAGDYDSPVPIGGPAEVRTFAQAFAGMASSLKDSHTALRKSADQIRNILESVSEGFFAFDHDWRCTYVNEKAVALTRVSREGLLGKKLWELVPRAVSSLVRAELQRVATEKVPAQFEQYYAPLDTWFAVSAYPTRDGLAVFARDVTEHKRFQEHLQQTQKLESLGLLAGGIAHDFNNLLTGIIGNASLALHDLPADSSLQPCLNDVLNAAQRAGALTQQLLAYAGKARFVIEPQNLSALVREISNLIKASIPKRVDLRLQLTEDLPSIEGDASQIQQLIMNLVINAGEAIGEGNHGTVLVTTSAQEVDGKFVQRVQAGDPLAPGNYVMLEVRDTGHGMTEETIARIFDPFFTTKFSGRGLGLAAATGIIRGHRGALRVQSVPGEGSTFQVLFPASEGVPVKAPPEVAVKDLKGSGTILVIDDEEIVRRTARFALERYGYTVIVSGSGKEALELVSKLDQPIVLALLDITMPGMSGVETLKRLKSIRPGLPVILSSGYAEDEIGQMLPDLERAAFIQKPYSSAELAEKVKIVLTKRDAVRA